MHFRMISINDALVLLTVQVNLTLNDTPQQIVECGKYEEHIKKLRNGVTMKVGCDVLFSFWILDHTIFYKKKMKIGIMYVSICIVIFCNCAK